MNILAYRGITLMVCDMAGTVINEGGLVYKTLYETYTTYKKLCMKHIKHNAKHMSPIKSNKTLYKTYTTYKNTYKTYKHLCKTYINLYKT